MKDTGFKPNSSGKYGEISSLYRSYSQQVGLAAGQVTAAKAGTSYHSWGVAVDMSWVNKEGKMMKFDYEHGSPKKDFDYDYNPGIEWLYNNSYRFGFINPYWARNVGNYDEAWHWEYHGKSAKCILQKNPTVFGKSIDMSKDYDIIVKNPKKPDGSETVYSGCEGKYIKRTGDGTNSGTIVEKSGCPTLVTKGGQRYDSKVMYTKLKTLTKLSDEAIGGIMGSLYRESNLSPQAFNNKSGGCGAYGLCQWRIDRLKVLASRAKATNRKIEDVDYQLDFLWAELTDETLPYRTWKYTLAALKKAKTIDDAAKIFSETYEAGNLGALDFNVAKITNTPMEEKRLRFARKFYNMIKTNTFINLTE